jgi:hypothetical protein
MWRKAMANKPYPHVVSGLIVLQYVSVFLLAILSAIVNLLRFRFDVLLGSTYRLLYSAGEINLPSWFSAINLAFSGLLLMVFALISSAKHRYNFQWFFLSLTFFFLSLDEATAIHETFYHSFSGLLSRVGYLTPGFGWVVIGIPLVAAFILSNIRFLAKLPVGVAKQMIYAGAVFVTGALGLEMVGSKYASHFGADLTYHLLATTEEACEMLGIAIFNHALLKRGLLFLMPHSNAVEKPLGYIGFARAFGIGALGLTGFVGVSALFVESKVATPKGIFIEARTPKSESDCKPMSLVNVKNNGGKWRGDSFLVCKVQEESPYVDFQLPLENSGRYRIFAHLTKGSSFSPVRIEVNKKAGLQNVDLWQGGSIYSPTQALEVGTYDIPSMNFTITLTAIGKPRSESEKSLFFGIDGFSLIPVKQ